MTDYKFTESEMKAAAAEAKKKERPTATGIGINPHGSGQLSVEIDADGRAVERFTGALKVNSDDLRPTGGGILSTAQNPGGGPCVNGFRPDATVEYGGTRITLATAATLGLVQRNADGTYTEVGAPAQQAPLNPQVTPAADTETETETETAGDIEVPPEAMQAVNDALFDEGYKDGLKGFVDEIVTERGLEGETADEARGKLNAVIQSGLAVISDELSKRGADSRDAAAAVEYIASHARATEALIHFVEGGDAGLLRQMVGEWLRNTPIGNDAESLPEGVQVIGFDSLGDRLIHLPNGAEISETVARRLGWL